MEHAFVFWHTGHVAADKHFGGVSPILYNARFQSLWARIAHTIGTAAQQIVDRVFGDAFYKTANSHGISYTVFIAIKKATTNECSRF